MGTIQNSMNQMLGTVAGAVTLGKHISNQNKELNVKKAEAEGQLAEAKHAEDVATTEAIKDAKFNDKETWDKATKNIHNETEGAVIDANKVLDEYNKIKQDEANKELQESHIGYDIANMGKNKKKINEASVRLAKAQMAYQEVQDAIEARRQLKFDVSVAEKKYNALKSNTLVSDVINNFRANKFKGGKE